MTRRNAQQGQALVGAMVIMLILFALAGGVAIAASGLLQQGSTRGAAITDLSAQSATADAISQVAGSTAQCHVPPSAAVFPHVDADDLTTLSLAFPNPVNVDTTWQAYCMRVDNAATPSNGGLWTNLQWQARCGSQGLPSQHVIVFFDARAGAGGIVYVDDQPGSVACRTSLPTSACSATSPQPGCVRCGKVIDPSMPLVQASLDCDLSSAGSSAMYLHFASNSAVQSPARVFVTGHDDNGGSIYLIATHHGATPTYEESVLLLPPGGGANQLLYEEPLP